MLSPVAAEEGVDLGEDGYLVSVFGKLRRALSVTQVTCMEMG